MTQTLVMLFGGPAQLAVAIRELYDQSAVKGKRHLRLRILLALVNLIQAVNRAREREGERFAHLTDDDINAVLERQLQELIAKCPEVVLMAAEAAGWTVVRPPDVERDAVGPQREATGPA